MPREATVKPNTRTVPDEKDTFRYSTPNLRVTADPVDAFVRPAKRNTGQQLLGVLDGLDASTGMLQEMAKKKQEDDREAGMIAAAKGEQLGPDASAAFIEGHETFQGMASAGELRAQFDAAFEKYKDEDPDTFAKVMDMLPRRYLAGRSDSFVKGIMGEAVKLQQDRFTQYQKHQQVRLAETGAENLRKYGRYEVENIIRQTALQPQAIDMETGETSAPDLGNPMRQLLNGMQAMGKQYGLDRNATTLLFKEIVDEAAEQKGLPELYDWAFVDDGTGNAAINSAAGELIEESKYRAMAQREALEAKAQTDMEKARTKSIQNLEATIVAAAQEGRLAEARAMLFQFSDPGRNEFGIALDATQINQYNDLIYKLQAGVGFSRVGNSTLTMDLWTKARSGEVTLKDLTQYQGLLTQDQFEEVAKAAGQFASDALKNDGKKTKEEKLFDDMKGRLSSILNPVDELGKYMDPTNGPMRVAKGYAELYKRVDNHVEEQKKYPTYDEMLGFVKAIRDDLFAENPHSFATIGGKTTTPTSNRQAAGMAPAGARRATQKGNLKQDFEALRLR